MMDSSESLAFLSTLLGDELSFWPLSLYDQENGTKHPVTKDVLLSPNEDGEENSDNVSVEDILDDPIPDWMSEKVSLSSWLEPLGIKSEQPTNIQFSLDTHTGLSNQPDLTPNVKLNHESMVTTQDETSLTEDLLNSCDEEWLNSLNNGATLPFENNNPLSPSKSEGVESPLQLEEFFSPKSSHENVLSPLMSVVSPSGSYQSEEGDLSSFPASPDSGFSGSAESEINVTTSSKVVTIQLQDLLKLCQGGVDNAGSNSFMSVGGLSTGSGINVKKVSSVVLLKEEEVKPNIFKVTPKVKTVSKDRKEKKRGQNKEAATRYRQKKKAESDSLMVEKSGLEKKNKELNEKVDSLEQEIKYLKTLMTEIYKVKGQIEVISASKSGV